MARTQVARGLSVSRFPWAAALITAFAAGVQVIPGAGSALEYDRGLVAGGDVWRLFSSQAVHWSWPMAGVDLFAALLAGLIVEMRSRWKLLLTVAISATAVGLAVHFSGEGVERYRGFSGVATALVVVAGLDLLADRARGARFLAATALVLVLAKISVEAATGRAVFPGTLPEGVNLSTEAHLAGALAGALVWISRRTAKRRRITECEAAMRRRPE
jgi:rhomboid family GlyGly-CTERM serine protease